MKMWRNKYSLFFVFVRQFLKCQIFLMERLKANVRCCATVGRSETCGSSVRVAGGGVVTLNEVSIVLFLAATAFDSMQKNLNSEIAFCLLDIRALRRRETSKVIFHSKRRNVCRLHSSKVKHDRQPKARWWSFLRVCFRDDCWDRKTLFQSLRRHQR